MKSADPLHDTGNNKGIALVITLLVVALITAMVVEFAYGVYVSTNSLYNWQKSQKLSLAAKSAVRLGPVLIGEKIAMDHYTPGLFEMTQKIPFDDPDGTIYLRIEDENSKFNLNCLINSNGTVNTFAYDSFVRLLKALKLKKESADRITDWMDPDSEPRLTDSEKGAKNSHLDSVDELLLIPGIDRETYDRLEPYVTIYGSTYENMLININGADVPVLMSLSDSITQEMAEQIIRYRTATPFTKTQDIQSVPGMDAIGPSLMGHINVQGTAFRIITTAESGGIKRIIECITDSSGSTIKYWREM